MHLFFNGLIVALLVSVPTGPVGFLTAERTLVKGVRSGIYSALGVIVADVFFAYLFAFHIGTILRPIHESHPFLHIVTAIILLGIGVSFFIDATKTKKITPKTSNVRNLGDFLSAFSIVSLNPMQAITFATITTAHVVHVEPSVMFVIGVLFGSLIWWAALIFFVSRIKQHISRKIYFWIDMVVGSVCVVSALLLLGAMLQWHL